MILGTESHKRHSVSYQGKRDRLEIESAEIAHTFLENERLRNI